MCQLSELQRSLQVSLRPSVKSEGTLNIRYKLPGAPGPTSSPSRLTGLPYRCLGPEEVLLSGRQGGILRSIEEGLPLLDRVQASLALEPRLDLSREVSPWAARAIQESASLSVAEHQWLRRRRIDCLRDVGRGFPARPVNLIPPGRSSFDREGVRFSPARAGARSRASNL